MPTTPPQPFDSTYFDSPYLNPSEAANVASDPTSPGLFDFSNIAFTPTSVVGGVVGVAYSQQLTISGGYAPYGNITIITGNLPANLSLSVTTNDIGNDTATANITGTPTTQQTANFTVQSIDAISNTSSLITTQDYSLAIAYPVITISPGSLANATVGQTYTQAFTASGGTGPYVYSNVGNLPPSLSLSSTGSLTGTITANTTPANITIVATDSYNSTGNSTYTLNIAQPAITVVPSTLSNGSVGTAYTATISATGGNTPYEFVVTAGSLPGNVTLNSVTGNITGTPLANGTANFTIAAYDLYRSPGNQSYTVGVTSPTVAITPATIANGVVGTPYTTTITATGGVAPYSWTTNNPRPQGLSLSGATAVGNIGTVVLSGTPTADGTYNFGVVATDSYGTQGVGNTYTVGITRPTITVTPSSLSNATTGAAYSATITATGGVAPYVFSVTGNSLPAALTLANTTGLLSGIVVDNANSPFNFTVTAYDSFNSPGNVNYSLTTTDPTILIGPSTIANGVVGVAYTQSLSSTGGTAPYTYSVTGGTLPANVALSTSGNLTGTPTTVQSTTFIVTSTDSFASTGAFTYNVGIAAPTIILDPTTLPDVIVNHSYSANIVAYGGTPPYTFAVTDGELPPGISLSTTGYFTGTPTTDATFEFTVTATDSYDSEGSQPYSITVTPPPIVIAPSTIPRGEANVAYSASFTASGGTAPYTYSANTLPAGMVLNSSAGILSGAPTESGYQPFTIIATDDNGYTGEQIYHFVAIPNIPTSAIEVYVGGIRQTTGYTVTSKSPATIEFTTPPPAGVDVIIAVRDGVSWYQPSPYSASDGVPLQETETPAARFLRGL